MQGSDRAGPLLRVADLRVDLVTPDRTVHAVRGLDYSISAGETLGIVGESGSGKTIGALSVMRLLPSVGKVVSGTITFDGQSMTTLPEDRLRELRGARIAMIFQDPLTSLNPVLSIGDQITEVLERHTSTRGSAADRRAAELLSLVGIPDPVQRLRSYPYQFSGGMRQRVMIAMAIACHPALLIADEPTTALDVTVQAQILDLLSRLRQELGMAILLISHDLGVVAGFTDRLAVMYAGRIVEVGPTGTVLAQPQHPYTRGLLASMPRLDEPKAADLLVIEGSPPDLASELTGCPFRPRCPLAFEPCAGQDPPITPRLGGGMAACWATAS